MKLMLHELCLVHAKLRPYPVDLSKCGGLALQRAGHTSPIKAGTNHDGIEDVAEIQWRLEQMTVLDDGLVDRNRLTEDGAEGVAIAYLHAKGGWLVKRRIQQGEHADWLMRKGADLMALEVSGTAAGDAFARLLEKERQVARCSLPAERLAIVVAFDKPLIVASHP